MALDPMPTDAAIDLILFVEDFEGRKYVNEFLAGPNHDIYASHPDLISEIRDAVRDHDAAANAAALQAKADQRRASHAAYLRSYRQRQFGGSGT